MILCINQMVSTVRAGTTVSCDLYILIKNGSPAGNYRYIQYLREKKGSPESFLMNVFFAKIVVSIKHID